MTLKLMYLLFFPIVALGQANLDQRISLLDNKVEIRVPKILTKMSDEMWSVKYRSRTRPILVLSDDAGEVNLIADFTQQAIAGNQLTAFKDAQIAHLKSSRPDLVFVGDGVKDIDGKKVAYFKFISQAVDQKVFNYYFFKIVNGKLLLFTFNCIERLRGSWEKTADEIVASLRVK